MHTQSASGSESAVYSRKAGWVNMSMKMTSDRQPVCFYLALFACQERRGKQIIIRGKIDIGHYEK